MSRLDKTRGGCLFVTPSAIHPNTFRPFPLEFSDLVNAIELLFFNLCCEGQPQHKCHFPAPHGAVTACSHSTESWRKFYVITKHTQAYSNTILFLITPISSISTSTTLPFFKKPLPLGSINSPTPLKYPSE